MVQSLVECFPEQGEIPVKTLLMHAERVRLAECARRGPARVLGVDAGDRARLAAEEGAVVGLAGAAARGDARAQVDAGLCYLHGVGGASQDDAQAARYFGAAAAQDDARGLAHLAYCLATGAGVDRGRARRRARAA